MKYLQMLETTEECKNLFELAAETPESDLETNEAIRSTLKQIEQDLETQLEAWGNLIKNLETEVSFLKDEASKLLTRARTIDRRCSWFKSKIKQLLEAAQKKTCKSGIRTFTVRKNSSPTVDIYCPQDVLEVERYVKIRREVDKVNLQADLLEGKEVNGAILQHNSHLIIR